LLVLGVELSSPELRIGKPFLLAEPEELIDAGADVEPVASFARLGHVGDPPQPLY
jgi:hypothetical protein